jgi:hypothetical protein
MREPRANGKLFGLMAEFSRPEDLIEAARRARAAGIERLDACSPFPLEDLGEILHIHDDRVPWLTLAGGILGAATGYGMQVYTNLAYPILIGGRPLIATPAFMLITFELTILFAVLFAIGGMLVLNRLPRLNHPLFGVPSFDLASSSKFFLVVFSDDPTFRPDRTRAFLESLRPVRVDAVYPTEEPE